MGGATTGSGGGVQIPSTFKKWGTGREYKLQHRESQSRYGHVVLIYLVKASKTVNIKES